MSDPFRKEFVLLRDPRGHAQARAVRLRFSDGADELHLCITPGRTSPTGKQLSELADGYRYALERLDVPRNSAVFRRIFLSDCANQAELLAHSPLAGDGLGAPVACSSIQQPPLPDHKFALWAYHVIGEGAPDKKASDRSVALRRHDRTHIWTADLTGPDGGAEVQTQGLFLGYESELAQFDANLRDHLQRTWLFVRDIDRDYEAMVKARRELFAERGLTHDTHTVASTGIQGCSGDPLRKVALDAYAATGLDPAQIEYLSAPDHLNAAGDYGVTFERGTAIDYGDRRHVFISGTASIDENGEIVHEGDFAGQIKRTFANIEALLHNTQSTTDDIALLIVYLRDHGDYAAARQFLEDRFAHAAYLIVHAPVCRPGWLVEVEAIAITAQRDERWSPF